MGLDRYKVARTEDGSLVAKDGQTLTLSMEIKVLPMTYGDSQSYDSFGLPVKKWKDEEKARLLTKNLVQLEGEEVGTVTADDLPEIEAYVLNDVLESVLFMSAINRLYDTPEDNAAEGNAEAPEESEEE